MLLRLLRSYLEKRRQRRLALELLQDLWSCGYDLEEEEDRRLLRKHVDAIIVGQEIKSE